MSFGENVDELKAVYGKYKFKIDIMEFDDKVVKFAIRGNQIKSTPTCIPLIISEIDRRGK